LFALKFICFSALRQMLQYMFYFTQTRRKALFSALDGIYIVAMIGTMFSASAGGLRANQFWALALMQSCR